jgi:hypothetical protein
VKLNLGCGKDIKEGWLNIDREPRPEGMGVSDYMVYDISRLMPLLETSSVDEMLLSHILEHIESPLPMMEELHRIARHDCLLTVKCPYGSSDDADEDPQHVRRYFLKSFTYFSQPAYWQASYGYSGDWQPVKVVLQIPVGRGATPEYDMMRRIMQYRNQVEQMVVTLRAVKPIREAKKELMKPLDVQFEYV